MLWLSFVPWGLRDWFLKPWPVFKTPDSYIQPPTCHLLLSPVCERSHPVRLPTWIPSSLTEPAPPSLPISADGSCMLLIAQAEALGVILDSCPLPHPKSNPSANPFSSASKAYLSPLQPWPKAPPSLPQIIIITLKLGSLLPGLPAHSILSKCPDLSFQNLNR